MKQYKVLLVSGGFDPLHKGHVEMIEAARKQAEEVWVILNNDQWLINKKGKAFMKEKEREYILSQIKGVTKTFICNPRIPKDHTVVDGIYSAIKEYQREFDGDLNIAFGNGGDRTQKNTPEEEYCNTMGVDMVWNLGKKVQSSSWLLDKYYNKA